MVGRIYRKFKTTLFKILFPQFSQAILYEIPRVYYKKHLKLGKEVHINESVFINAVGKVTIGDACVLSHGVTIVSTELDTKKWMERTVSEDIHIDRPINIGKNVWLCANVTICAGVNIADSSIVAAGAVVTSDLKEPGCLYGGIPAKLIKRLE